MEPGDYLVTSKSRYRIIKAAFDSEHVEVEVITSEYPTMKPGMLTKFSTRELIDYIGNGRIKVEKSHRLSRLEMIEIDD